MPDYAYFCRKCGERFTVERKITEDRSDVRCPKCGEKPTRIIEATSFVFKCGGATPKGS